MAGSFFSGEGERVTSPTCCWMSGIEISSSFEVKIVRFLVSEVYLVFVEIFRVFFYSYFCWKSEMSPEHLRLKL